MWRVPARRYVERVERTRGRVDQLRRLQATPVARRDRRAQRPRPSPNALRDPCAPCSGPTGMSMFAIVGYRDWARQLYKLVKDSDVGDEVHFYETLPKDDVYSYNAVFFVGWSEMVPQE